jgi:phage shock protein A
MSGVITKLFAALRGAANEAGEMAVDANATRILDQEIRDADAELRAARIALANLMAKQTLEKNGLTDKQTKIDEYAGYIRQTLAAQKAAEGSQQASQAAQHAALATDLATKYADLETQLKTSQQVIAEYEKNILTLKQKIVAGEGVIKALKQRADTVKAKQHVIKASAAVAAASSGTDTHMRSALDSLDRIEKRQAENLAQIDAANQLAAESNGDALEERLKQAGIIPGARKASDVLARFQAESSSPPSS